MVGLSKHIDDIKANTSKLQFRYWKDDDRFGIPFYHHGECVISVIFDSWTGKLLEGSFKDFVEGVEALEESIKHDIMNEIKQKHNVGSCKSLSYYIDAGEDFGMTPIIHIPNIRTYAILNKKEYGGFEPMDFCPFCGAKFPERLDGELTEILRNEYNLGSWKDYKKAPHEFHTDEWWRKRGL